MNTLDVRKLLEDILPYPIRWRREEGVTRCPFHDDQRPSFSVNYAKQVWKCFASCGGGTIDMLMKRLGVDPPAFLPPAEHSDTLSPIRKYKRHDVEYVYKDSQGKPVFLVGRYCSSEGKNFAMYHLDNNEWYYGKGEHHSIPYQLPEVIDAIDRGMPVVIVEGEKDADTLNRMFQHNQLVATTNMGGALKWPADDQYNCYFWKADIFIIPDNDDIGRQHAQRVAESVRRYAKSVRINDLSGLIPKGDVTDWFESGYTAEDLLALMQNDDHVQVDVPRKIEIDVLRKYFDGSKFVPALLAKDVVQAATCFFDGNKLYAYQDGVYQSNGQLTVRRLCQKFLGNEYRINRVNEAIHYIETASFAEMQNINVDDGQINLLNGLLRLSDLSLKQHTSDRLSTIQLPVNYDPTATCPQIEAFLAQVIPADAIPTVMEFIGYCLLMNAKFEKALMLTGTGANGKSTLIKLISAFLGKNNTTSIPLQELADSRWKRADLQGTLLNSFADIPSRLLETSSVFKAIVSGDEIDAERKGKDPFYFKPYAKQLFSANEMPGSKDLSQAFFRRWIVVPFPNNFKYGRNADPDLIAKLTSAAELSGLLNLALEGLNRLQSTKQFTETESTKRAKEIFIKEVDSLVAFVDECCELRPDATCEPIYLYGRYKEWCDESGLKWPGKIQFHKRLQEQFPVISKGGKHQQEHWKGITLFF